MLHFSGIGSAFNTDLGNTSAFMKQNQGMILIDCGGTVFHRMKRLNLFQEVKQLHVIITHTHPDHIGSLGEVIFYAYYQLKIKPVLYYPNKKLLVSLLSGMGVEKEMYDFINKIENDILVHPKLEFKFLSVPHLKTVDAYGILFHINDQHIYYSGDSNSIPTEIMKLVITNQLGHLYQDTCGIDYEGNGHLSLTKLTQMIPFEFRHKVTCMHLDQFIDIDEVKRLGFHVASIDS